MGKLNVKNGTPVGNAHLCRNCTNGQFTTGYRESDVLVICTNSSPARIVPFPVHECTSIRDRNRPDWEQMEKLAISFTAEPQPQAHSGLSRSGFASVPVVVEDEDECEDELEEVARKLAAITNANDAGTAGGAGHGYFWWSAAFIAESQVRILPSGFAGRS